MLQAAHRRFWEELMVEEACVPHSRVWKMRPRYCNPLQGCCEWPKTFNWGLPPKGSIHSQGHHGSNICQMPDGSWRTMDDGFSLRIFFILSFEYEMVLLIWFLLKRLYMHIMCFNQCHPTPPFQTSLVPIPNYSLPTSPIFLFCFSQIGSA